MKRPCSLESTLKKWCLLFAIAGLPLSAQVNPALFSDMKWREIGPFRAGRTRALSGVPSEPYVFYIGAVNGGVWKTEDAGNTWRPLFTGQPTGSIGAMVVAPSDPNVIYVGSGEGLLRPDLSIGDGMYKSTDAGKSWTHLGLRDTQQIPQVAVDPHDPNRLFVAALGHPYGPSEERGIFRSTDGGKTFQKILYKDANTGASEVQIDPNHPNVIFAGLWESRQGPWENAAWTGHEGGIFKSVDGGDTWNKIEGHGLPDGIVQADIAIAPSDSNRIYSTIAIGPQIRIYRSDDGGENWTQATEDPRPAARIGGGDVPVPKVDPKNPDVVYVCSIVTWKSSNGGKTWLALRGSPGGDDYQNMWINPNDTRIILLTSDQGSIVTVNGGQSWTSWYNQPTAQMFHVTIDNAFPYRACGGQQDSGSACVSSRGNDGQITFHDWHPVGVEEYGYAAPDPKDPDLVYGGKVTRYNRRTGQVAYVDPKPLRQYRVVRTQPLVFSPADPHVLFFAANTLWKTTDGGDNWSEISQDLTRKTWQIPDSVGIFKKEPSAQPTQRGVIYAVAPSPLKAGRIWAGTDDGLIWMTSDGGQQWNNVTPPELKPWWKVSIMDAGHFDADTAYAAINTFRLDDMRPHLFRTHDAGKTWQEINKGIPDGAATDVIREDPKHKGLLFAGTETQVYVSFDDGDHWQSLRLNMGASSVRDLQIKGDDLVACTHGLGFLILDDITPLRQIDPGGSSKTLLYQPQVALRIRNDMNPPTPWVPEMPAAKNPPHGAVIDYFVEAGASGPVSLEISDASGNLVRRYSSTDPVPPRDPLYPVPLYWERPPQILAGSRGHHRFVWDELYTPVPGLHTEPDADQAVPHDTPLTSTSPWVMPGTYAVKLTAGGQSYSAPLTVKMDPRVKTSMADLKEQFDLSVRAYKGVTDASAAIEQANVLREQLHTRPAQGANPQSPDELEKQLEAILGSSSVSRHGPRGAHTGSSLVDVRAQLQRLQGSMQNADVAPTAAQAEATNATLRSLHTVIQQWKAFKAKESVSRR